MYSFGELGSPNFSNLIEKVQKHLIGDRSLHETLQVINSNLDWRIKRIPRRLVDGSDLDDSSIGAIGSEMLNGQYLSLHSFLSKLDKAL